MKKEKIKQDRHNMILVTGATGMVGAHLLMALAQQNDTIRATRRESSSLKAVDNIFHFFAKEQAEQLMQKIEWVNADLRDPEQIQRALKGVDTIYHTAAIVSFQKKDDQLMIENNREATANLIDFALENKISKFCHVSSVASLEKIPEKKFTNEDNIWKSDKNKNAYSISKFQSEMEVWRGHEMGLPVVIINPSVILGSGDWKKGSPRFFSSIAKRLYFYSEGGTGFVDVMDCVDAMLQLTSSENWDKVKGKRFVLNNKNIKYKELFDTIAKELDCKSPQWKITRKGMKFAYWIDAFLSTLLFRAPKITKATIKSATQQSFYDGSRITQVIGFQYRDISESIHRIAEQYKLEHA